MYFVNDLYNDTCAKAGSMTDIAYWWHRKVGRDFFQLNVTGKDTHTAMEKDGSWLHIQENGRSYVIPTYKKVIYLRRYQVLDEDGRSVDIRTWPKSVWEWTPTYPPCYWPCGFKSNYHRISGPSMWRGTYRASMRPFPSPFGTALMCGFLSMGRMTCGVTTMATTAIGGPRAGRTRPRPANSGLSTREKGRTARTSGPDMTGSWRCFWPGTLTIPVRRLRDE